MYNGWTARSDLGLLSEVDSNELRPELLRLDEFDE